MRGGQISRQWQILRKIEVSKYGLSAAEIAEQRGVSLRTAYRDLDDLQKAGFPLYQEKSDQGQRWKFLESFQFQLPLPFTYTELMALHLSRDLFKVFKGTVFHDSLESLVEKIYTNLVPETVKYLENIQATFHTGIRPYKDYQRFREIVTQVNQAAVEKLCIEIGYQPLHASSAELRKIEPYKIWFYEGTIYVIGLCHLRNEIRTFVIDRITMLNMTNESFEMPADFDFQKYIGSGFKVMHDELYTVKILISPAWSRYVGEKIWHESQMIQKRFDGSIEINFKVAGLDEIKQWVLGFGPEAVVMAPEELRDMIQADLRKSLFQYQKGILFQEPEQKEQISSTT